MTVLFADAAQVNDFQAPASPGNPLFEEFYYLSPYEDTTHFRHRETASAVFADGHVDALKSAAGYDRRLPGDFIGRLAMEDLKP